MDERSGLAVQPDEPVNLTPTFNFRKIKLLFRSNIVKLQKSKGEVDILNRILLAIKYYNEKDMSAFELIKQISLAIRAMPEGSLKEKHPEINWKYLIQLYRSLLMLKNDKKHVCDLIIMHDLPLLTEFFEKLRAEALKNSNELELANAKIAAKLDNVFPAVEKKYRLLRDEINLISFLSSLIESLLSVNIQGGYKREQLLGKIEELKKFCVDNQENLFIVTFYKDCFSVDGHLDLEKAASYKKNLQFYRYKIESQLGDLTYRINLIVNNDELKENLKNLYILGQKVKKLGENVPQISSVGSEKLMRDLIDLKSFLLRLNSEEERSIGSLSPKKTNEIFSKIENLPDEIEKIDLVSLKKIEELIENIISSMEKDFYADDLKNLVAIFSELLSLNGGVTAGLSVDSNSEQLLKSLKKEIMKIEGYIKKIYSHKDDERGLLAVVQRAEEVLKNIMALGGGKDPSDLLVLASKLLPDVYALLVEAHLGQKIEVDFMLFDIHKRTVSSLKKHSVSGNGVSNLKKMISDFIGYCSKFEGNSTVSAVKKAIEKFEDIDDFDNFELQKVVTRCCSEFESLKSEMKSNIVFSQTANKLSDIQKSLMLARKLSIEAQSLLLFYVPTNIKLWGSAENFEKVKTECNGLRDVRENIFVAHVILLSEYLEKAQENRVRHGQSVKKRETLRLPVIDAFIGYEYDKANINVVLKYLDILLTKDGSLQAVRAAMLATLLIMGEAFKDISPAMKKSGLLKTWFGFYAIRNAIHSILGDEGRSKLEYLLKSSDGMVIRFIGECFQDLTRIKQRLIRIRDNLPPASEMITLVESAIRDEPRTVVRDKDDVVLPPALGLLHYFLTSPQGVFTSATRDNILIVVKKRVDQNLVDTFYSDSLGSRVKSVQQEADSLEKYSADFSNDPETFSLACEFSVAYCGDVARGLLVEPDYCDHLSEHFLNLHYLIKAERGDLMHDRVLKTEKFEDLKVKYVWVSSELAPCTLLAFCATKLETLAQDRTGLIEDDFVGLNQWFNKKITSHFNRIKRFLIEALGEAEWESIRIYPDTINLSALRPFLEKIEKKQDFLKSIEFLCSPYPSEMALDFEKLEKKWGVEMDFRYVEVEEISRKILNIQEDAQHKGLSELENYAKEIDQRVLGATKSQLKEQSEGIKSVVEQHRKDTLNRNVEKFTYFPPVLLAELVKMLSTEQKKTETEKPFAQDEDASRKRRGPGVH